MDLALFSITLNTNQLENMKSFYQALGCQFKSLNVDKGGVVQKTQIGNLEFALHSIGNAADVKKIPIMQLSLKVRDLDSIMGRVQAIPGVSVILDPSDMPEGRRSIILDPDGNSIDLTEERDTH